MTPTGSRQQTNALIAMLPEEEGLRFTDLCRGVQLDQGDVLYESNEPQQVAYFPLSGVISLATTLGSRPPLQLGLIGSDGMLGATLSPNVLTAPMGAVVQVAGQALVLNLSQLHQELRTSSSLLEVVHHYQYRLMMQILQTAACLHFHEIEPRLARWLLMTQNLSRTDRVRFTHKLLSNALGVRRSGVTLAAGSLQRKGLIRYTRGEIHILDQTGLEAAACECNAALTDSYRNVFGSS